jgi:mRNA interferase HigB
MKVHLIKVQTIEDYILKNAKSRMPFDNWLAILKSANWNEPKDVIATFGSADNLGNGSNRIVFNIGGNNYRVICKYVFGAKRTHLFVCWIGTHGQYTELCRQNKQYTVNIY